MENTAHKQCRTLELSRDPQLQLGPVSIERVSDRLLNSHEVADILGCRRQLGEEPLYPSEALPAIRPVRRWSLRYATLSARSDFAIH